MDCKQWRDMASDYLEGALPTATHEAMRLHVSSCVACRRDETTLRVLCRELNVLPTVDPPLFFAENVRSAIDRQRNSQAANAPWWRTVFLGDNTGTRPPVFGQMGRVAVGTLLTGGVVAAIGWTLLLAGSPHSTKDANLAGAVPGLPSTVGGLATEGAAVGAEPVLRIAQVTTMTPGSGPAYDLSFWLDNAERGVAHWKFVGDPRAYSFVLKHEAPQTVRVPYSVAAGNSAIALSVRWTSGGSSHTRYILLPGAAGANGVATDSAHSDTPAERQSFGLPEESVLDAAREMSARYGSEITLDDVPEALRVRVTAQDETAGDALKRTLADAGLTVTTDATGIHVVSPVGSKTSGSDAEPGEKPSAE